MKSRVLLENCWIKKPMEKNKMKILVIDDDISITRLLKKILENEGHTVQTACDGKEGLSILDDKTDIDLVITDIVMPEKEGIETIMAIRRNKYDVKIIAISGGGRLKPDSYLTVAEKLGADEVLKKPFDTMELLDAIKKIKPKGTSKNQSH